MRILIANAWLDLYGGSENWVLTMCQAFKKLGADVEVLTNNYGVIWSNQIEPLGVTKATGGKYDLMLINHGTHFPQVQKWQGKKVNIIHGLTPSAEKPIDWADYYIGISDEIAYSLKLDDVVGAIPVHMFAGIWGTLVVPLTNPDASYSIQLLGVASVCIFVFVFSYIVIYLIKNIMGLRISEEAEKLGTDKAEVGVVAYSIRD